MSEDSPFDTEADGSFSLTLKADKGYEAPWFNIRGRTAAELKEHVGTAFEIEGWEQMTLVEVIAEATALFQAIEQVRAKLGGRPIRNAAAARARADAAKGDVWAEAEAAVAEGEEKQQEPVDPDAALLEEISNATEPMQLKQLWARENAAGRPLNETVEAAWRAKGKALQGGSK